FAYDPINDRLWIGDGTGSTMLGINYFDPNTNAVVPHTVNGARFGSESAAVFDPAGKQLIVFGGGGLLSVHTFALDPPASAMVHAGISGGPSWAPGDSNLNAVQK